MFSNAFIWRTANFLVRIHGPEAELRVARQLDATLSSGQQPEAEAWRQILAAIAELRRTRPRVDESIH